MTLADSVFLKTVLREKFSFHLARFKRKPIRTNDTSPSDRLHTLRLFLPEARSYRIRNNHKLEINETTTNLRPVKLYAFQINVAQSK